MPIYEYHCSACGKDFERLVRGETRVACPGCASRKVERRMSAPARQSSGHSDFNLSTLGPPKVTGGGGGGGCGGGGCGCH